MKCKYGCGAEFPNTPKGKAEYMRHVQYECPKYEKSRASVDKMLGDQKKEIIPEKKLGDDEYLDEMEILDKIIAETTTSIKRPAIVRMVRRHMGNKEESIKVLADGLRIADIPVNTRNLIVKNWAAHLEYPDVDELLDKEKREEKKKTSDEEDKEKKKDAFDAVDKEIDKMLEDEMRYTKLVRLRKERKLLEQELAEPPSKKEEEEKIDYVVEGVTLRVTPQQMLAYKRWELEQKKLEEEREERKEERKRQEDERLSRYEDQKSRKDEDSVEWVIGEKGNTKTIKVRPETIPLLIQAQKGGGDSDEVKELRNELKEQRALFQQFQTSVLQNELNEMKGQLAVDPLDRILHQKQKLETLGLVPSGKTSAQEQMYDMDRKKLDTLLEVFKDKSISVEKKMNMIIDAFGPLAQEYVKDAAKNLRKQRGETVPEKTRTDADAEETIRQLDAIDEQMSEPSSGASTTSASAPEKPSNPPKVVSVEKTKKEEKK